MTCLVQDQPMLKVNTKYYLHMSTLCNHVCSELKFWFYGNSLGTLVYAGSKAVKHEQKFASGTEVRFDCVQGQKRSWKIVCSNGRWVGLSLGCDENGQPQEVARGTFNASCSYSGPPPDSNVVGFFEDSQIAIGEEVRYEPGAELVFRCVDIGKRRVSNANTYFTQSKSQKPEFSSK